MNTLQLQRSLFGGGTISGNLTITGTLTVTGSTVTITDTTTGQLIVDHTATEAFLVRVDSDGGDLFLIDTTNSQIDVIDDIRFRWGTGGDIASVNRSTSLTANTTLTDVLIGTPIVPAIPANSLIISNITADGDIVFVTQTGGNSIEGMRIDASTRSLVLPQVDDPVTPTLAFGDGNTGFYEVSDDQLGITIAGALQIFISTTELRGTGIGVFAIQHSQGLSSTAPIYTFETDEDTGIGSVAADQLSLIAGGHEMLRLTEDTALANYVAASFDAADQVDLTSASGSTWRLIQTTPVTVDWDGGVTITALHGQTAYFDVQTNTADQATIATNASSVFIVGPPIDDTNFTHTYEAALWIDAGHLRLPSENDAVTPTLAFGDGDTGFYESTDNQIDVAIGGNQRHLFSNNSLQSAASSGYFLQRNAGSSTDPIHTFNADTDTGIGRAAADQLSVIAGGVELMRLTQNDAAVDVLTLTGNTDISGRILKTQGADVASATDLTLGTDGNSFELTGTTKVDLISSTDWQEGAEITLIANENVTIDHGTVTSGSNITILLSGAVDFAMTANDTLKLILSSTTAGGQAWRELTRTAI